MPVTLFSESHRKEVLAIKNAMFASMNLGQFVWQPCQQIESLDQRSFRYVFEDGVVNGYGAAYQWSRGSQVRESVHIGHKGAHRRHMVYTIQPFL
jgi:hypothetical protein